MKRILVVDDDRDLLPAIHDVLSDMGYEVIECNTGEALNHIPEIAPDLILLDVWLPAADGDTLCGALKSSPATSHVPVILISAVNNLQDLVQKCHADGYIEKPFDINHLESTIRNAIGS